MHSPLSSKAPGGPAGQRARATAPETVGEGGQDPSLRKGAWSPHKTQKGLPWACDLQLGTRRSSSRVPPPHSEGTRLFARGPHNVGLRGSAGAARGCGVGGGRAGPHLSTAGRSPRPQGAVPQRGLRAVHPTPCSSSSSGSLDHTPVLGLGRDVGVAAAELPADGGRRPARCTCASPRAASRSLPPAAGAQLSSGTFRPDFSKLEV